MAFLAITFSNMRTFAPIAVSVVLGDVLGSRIQVGDVDIGELGDRE